MASRQICTIFTRQGDVADQGEFGEVRLGGVTLYADSEQKLSDAVEFLEDSLVEVVRGAPSADRHSMSALLMRDAAKGVNRRVLGAIIGSVLRQGRLSTLQGESEGGETVTIVCALERRAEFEARVGQLEQMLRSDGETLIRRLRDAFFPGGESGAWTWTWHLAARAAYLGRACFVDRYRLSWPGDFADVMGPPR